MRTAEVTPGLTAAAVARLQDPLVHNDYRRIASATPLKKGGVVRLPPFFSLSVQSGTNLNQNWSQKTSVPCMMDGPQSFPTCLLCSSYLCSFCGSAKI